MPVITKLLFSENHVVVELDGGESLRVSYDVYTGYRLCSGMDLSGDLYMEVYDESRRFECCSRALSYLGLRARSVEEMKRYLRKKNFDERHISEAVEYLKGKGYLNDYGFAILYTKDRMRSGRRGKDLIVRDLYRKGIGRKEIDKAIKECGADKADEEAVYALAKKKYESVKNKENPALKVSNYLRQRGFDYDIIKKVLRRLGEDVEE
ncbi:MAG TPA: RecX family transcriptional regulator [Spirochaetota bacterium]|nr:RecX family transcriptional regulator [Spirochaetota bacterium]